MSVRAPAMHSMNRHASGRSLEEYARRILHDGSCEKVASRRAGIIPVCPRVARRDTRSRHGKDLSVSEDVRTRWFDWRWVAHASESAIHQPP